MKHLLLSILAAAVLVPPAASAGPFTAHGYIVEDFLGCKVFWDSDGAHGGLKLDDYAGFSGGDYVIVTGDIAYCASGCEYVYECVHVTSISPWPEDFHACGTFVDDECGYLQTDDGRKYEGVDFRGFSPGDRVHVTGHLIQTSCVHFCTPVDTPCVFSSTTVVCTAASVGPVDSSPVGWGAVKVLFR